MQTPVQGEVVLCPHYLPPPACVPTVSPCGTVIPWSPCHRIVEFSHQNVCTLVSVRVHLLFKILFIYLTEGERAQVAERQVGGGEAGSLPSKVPKAELDHGTLRP